MFGPKHVWGWLYPYQGGTKAKALKKHSYTVGKDSSCDLVLSKLQVTNEDDYLSLGKQHFKIKKKDDGVFLEDISRNHTVVNSKTMTVGERIKLRHNDVIGVLKPQLKVFVYLENSMIEKSDFPEEVKQKYVVSYVLGDGGYGEVYLVFQKDNCKRYAMKKVWKVEENSKNLNREIEILRTLDHPCLIHMHETMESPGNIFIVLEHMVGGDLMSRIFPKKHLTDQDAKLIFYQLTLAVQYLHSKQIAHRDIKPENILLATEDSQTLIKVTDFGLSKVEQDTKLVTAVGTPVFAAPEIVINMDKQKQYTKQVDVWSMGVVLYFCISSTIPFHYNGSLTVWECQYLPSVWSQRSVIKDLVKRMLEVEPGRRISIDSILSHDWLKDETMRAKAHSLMYPGEEYRPAVEIEPVSPKAAFMQDEIKLRSVAKDRHSLGIRVLPPGPVNRKSVPIPIAVPSVPFDNATADKTFCRSSSLRKSTSPLEKKSSSPFKTEESSFKKSWSLRILNGAPKPPPKPLKITVTHDEKPLSNDTTASNDLSEVNMKSPMKPPRTFQHFSNEPNSPKSPTKHEAILEENEPQDVRCSNNVNSSSNSPTKYVTYTKQNPSLQKVPRPSPAPRTSLGSNEKLFERDKQGSVENFESLSLEEQKRLHEQTLVGVPIPPIKPSRNSVVPDKKQISSSPNGKVYKSSSSDSPVAAQTFVKVKRQAPKPPAKPLTHLKMEDLGKV